MNTTNTVLDRIKSQYRLPSDYAIAKLLGLTKGAIYNYRKNRSNFDDGAAYRAANLVKINPVELVASLHKERASCDDEYQVWSKIAKEVKFIKLVKKQEAIDALNAAGNGDLSPSQRKIILKIAEQCILCKIAIKRKN